MRPRIIIEETDTAGRARLAAGPSPAGRLDLQDVLIVGGIVLLELGAYFVWRPAALILGGCFCFSFAYLIERSRAREQRQANLGNPES